jgi:hypothetical protein
MTSPRSLVADAVAGVPGAIGSVADGMAASVLAGVNPIHGLFASAVGPIGASSRRAYREAETWLIGHRTDPADEPSEASR